MGYPARPFWVLSVLLQIAATGPLWSAPGDDETKPLAAPEARASTASLPQIMTREQWKAKPALPGMKEQKIVGIVLHHTAVRKNFTVPLDAKLRNLQTFSQQPGRISPTHEKPAWPDVPYHYYVGATGAIAEGRDVRYAGDTNTKYDTSGYIQVVIEGDFEREAPEAAELASTRDLLVWLMRTWDIPIDRITVHKDRAATTCPGANFMAVLPKLLENVAAQNKRSSTNARQRAPLPLAYWPDPDWRGSLARDRR